MFTKIDIEKFGLYKDFEWGSLPALGRVNIIYGRNYSGKTTLSRIFDSVSQGELHGKYLDGKFKLYTDEAVPTIVTESNLSDGCPYQIRVYNTDYVKRHLDFLNNEDSGEITPFALIGSDNVEAQKAIDKIDEKLGSVEEKKGLLYQNDLKFQEYLAKKGVFDDDVAGFENQLRNKANGEIKRNKYFVKQGTNYNVNNIHNDIAQLLNSEVLPVEKEGDPIFHHYTLDSSKELATEEKEQLQKTVNEAQKPTIRPLPEAETHLKGFYDNVKELVPKKITLTKTLQELVEDDLLQAWVDEGRERNKDRETCAFCGGIITKERWDALNAHFSKESDELKQSLLGKKKELEDAKEALDGYLERMNFKKENIYAENLKEYEAVIEDWNTYVEKYKKVVELLLGLINSRLGNIFKPVEFVMEGVSIDSLKLAPVLKRINEVIELNNQYGTQLETKQQEARDKLRLDEVYQFCTVIDYTAALERQEKEEVEAEAKKREMEKVASEINELKELRKKKEGEKKDEGLAARKVTDLLVNHFGNGSLRLEPETVEDEFDEDTGEVKPRTRFVVKRGDDIASNLSEGEKSLISFCYFIARMADELNGPDANKLVVFIDDPISSLDSSHIFFMYSLIETVFVKKLCFGQLFVSTHNLEFLKFMKRFRPVVTTGSKTISKYVVVKLGKGNTDDYRCEIRQMPDYLSRYMTEYNFLFEQIYEIAELNSEEEQVLYAEKYTLYYNIGNNMRKFLECYLFNRYPDAEEPLRAHLDKLFDNNVPSQVNRVVNEYSHLVWAERGMRVMDAPEVVTAARDILKALRTKDWEHYKTLCQSVNKDENVTFAS